MNLMPTQVTVSVIIVSWNARNYLMKCLASLSAEVCRYPMEIIVVDNASSDGSPEGVESEYPGVRLIRNEDNLGFAKANNIGISFSKGKYLCLINSDVEVLPGCISRLVDYCEENQEVGMAAPRIIGADEQLQRTCRGFPSLWNMFFRALALDNIFKNCRLFTGYSLWHWPQDTLEEVDIIGGCFWLIRRKALDQVGLLDESFFIYGEDMDWCKRCWIKGWRVVFFPSAEAIHYGGASSSNAPVRFYIERHRADLQYWKKHHSQPAAACYFAITCLHLILRGISYSFRLLINPAQKTWRHKAERSWLCLKWMLLSNIGVTK